jgi:ABC-type multidrug transport system fused ATPase/permease subunit
VTEPTSEGPSSPRDDQITQAPLSTKPLVSKRTRRSTAIISVIVTLVAIAVLVGIGYVMFKAYDWAAPGTTPGTVRVRDIAIVVMALETLLVMLLVLIIVVLVVVVIVLIYDRVIPILEQLNRAINTAADAMHTARGTTAFVSEKLVSPVIEVSSYAAGVARIARELAALWPWRKGNGAAQGTAAQRTAAQSEQVQAQETTEGPPTT